MNRTIILEIDESVIIGDTTEVMGSAVMSGPGARVGIVTKVERKRTLDTDGRDAEAVELTVLLNKEAFFKKKEAAAEGSCSTCDAQDENAIYCRRGVDRISASVVSCSQYEPNKKRLEIKKGTKRETIEGELLEIHSNNERIEQISLAIDTKKTLKAIRKIGATMLRIEKLLKAKK